VQKRKLAAASAYVNLRPKNSKFLAPRKTRPRIPLEDERLSVDRLSRNLKNEPQEWADLLTLSWQRIESAPFLTRTLRQKWETTNLSLSLAGFFFSWDGWSDLLTLS
jgi:hypothetical protein